MRKDFASKNTLGEKYTSQVGSTRWEGTETWIVGGVIVLGAAVVILLLSRL